MKQLLTFIAAVLILFSFSSCLKEIILNKFGIFDNYGEFKTAKNSEKEILFIPMHHIGTKPFYDDIKKKIDSLRKIGYVFYYEGVKYFKENDSLKNDTLRRKVRKVLGIDILTIKSQGGYIDTNMNTMAGIKSNLIAKYKLVNQPKKSDLGLDSLTDKWADGYLSDLMPALEEKFGKIILEDCDFNTKYELKYSCKKYRNKEAKKFLLEGYRNSIISNEILNDTHNKIVIVYGAKHFEGVVENLQKQDSTWRIIKQ